MRHFKFNKIALCKDSVIVYAIKGLYNGFHLVGQTRRSFYKRCSEHRSTLRNGSHDNEFLQNAYNKNGESNFVFVLLENVTEISLLNAREKYWIDYLKSYSIDSGWNIREGGTKNDYGEAYRQKLSLAIRNSPLALSSRHARRKTYTLVSPSGEVVTFTGLRKFCEENNVASASICKLFKGIVAHVAGWTLPVLAREPYAGGASRPEKRPTIKAAQGESNLVCT